MISAVPGNHAFDVEVFEVDDDAFVVVSVEQIVALSIIRVATRKVRRHKRTILRHRAPIQKPTFYDNDGRNRRLPQATTAATQNAVYYLIFV